MTLLSYSPRSEEAYRHGQLHLGYTRFFFFFSFSVPSHCRWYGLIPEPSGFSRDSLKHQYESRLGSVC